MSGDSLIYVYIFLALAALTITLNLVFRLLNDRKGQFAVNLIFLSALIASAAILIFLGYSGTVAGIFSINPFSTFLFALFTTGLLLVNMIAFNYSENYMDFTVIGNFALLGMYLVAASTSVITIFLGLELSACRWCSRYCCRKRA